MSEQSFNPALEDEISLKDIIDFLVESWKSILVTGVLGILGAITYITVTPNMYQATANIQMAKVAGTDVELPAILIEKLKMPMYYSQKTYSACNVMDKVAPGEAIAKSLMPTLSKTAPIITFSYKEESPEAAQQCLESVLEDVRTNQKLLAKPIFDAKSYQLVNLKQKLEAAEKTLKILPNKNSNFDFTDSKFSASTLLLATTLNKENEIKDLRTQVNDLEVSLTEPQTRETFLAAPIYAPQQKVSPKRGIALIAGLMGGLFLGLVLVLGQRAYRSYKASSK
ncbi:hypothetical protein ICN28_03965 [Polynucleobacter sp. 30F-ANTBAC]|uniref:Wzz/FepE/Etk N-terminal domain-containing protein n=1 Tax=Polynucleobacter sp. 30F-ANTBAC TaxID=2689095 RepID=UPI001C0D048A|nr:Wzz/FepE/Etk N-terminal domain-containing protein [Polynucleobacter sp. 30F-ANTBAC]MBU3599669.1 hypothetical protein [Polynucleobacter sp. 30F-ANTBAC]